MKMVFRADATPQIGSGHAMRISAIAEEAIARGITAIFVGKIVGLPWVLNRIIDLQFAAVIENSDDFKSDPNEDILIIDSYELGVSDDFLQPNRWKHVVSIFDDLTPNYRADLSIHTGLSRYSTRSGSKRTICGTLYFPLRKSIRRLNRSAKCNTLDISVVGGGSDLTKFVPAIAQLLLTTDADFEAKLFTDQVNLKLDQRFSIFPIGTEMDLVSQNSELVFSTASTSSLEFMARGAAVGIGCSVINQESYYLNLVEGGFAAPVGKFLKNAWDLNSEKISDLLNSTSLRNALQEKSSELIDSFGSTRIIDEVLSI